MPSGWGRGTSAGAKVTPRPTEPPAPPPAPRRAPLVFRVRRAVPHAPAQVRGTLPADQVEWLTDLVAGRDRGYVREILRSSIVLVDVLDEAR